MFNFENSCHSQLFHKKSDLSELLCCVITIVINAFTSIILSISFFFHRVLNRKFKIKINHFVTKVFFTGNHSLNIKTCHAPPVIVNFIFRKLKSYIRICQIEFRIRIIILLQDLFWISTKTLSIQ